MNRVARGVVLGIVVGALLGALGGFLLQKIFGSGTSTTYEFVGAFVGLCVGVLLGMFYGGAVAIGRATPEDPPYLGGPSDGGKGEA
jgi:hypothetical protein